MRSSMAAGLWCLSAAACVSDLPEENPYDPGADPAEQAEATLQGRVTLSEEQPRLLRGAVLRLRNETTGVTERVETLEDGAYLFSGLTPGDYVLNAQHLAANSDSRELVLGPGEARTVDFALAPLSLDAATSGVLRGRVFKEIELGLPEDARDHSGILVEVEGGDLRTTTDIEGAFELLLSEGRVNLVLRAASHVPRRVEGVDIVAGEVTVLEESITLEASPATLRAEAGGGTILQEVLPAGSPPVAAIDATVRLVGTSSTTTTDADGRFQLTDVIPGSYTLRIVKDGFDPVERPGVVLRGGEIWVLEEDLLLPISRGLVAGVVVTADGGSPEGAVASAGPHSTLTDAQGRFAIAALPVGDYQIVVRHEGYDRAVLPALTTVTANSRSDVGEVTLTRQRGGIAIAGEPDVVPAPEISLALTPPAGAATVCATTERAMLEDAERAGEREACHVALPDEGMLAFTLPEGDGPKTVYAVFRGADGLRSSIFEASTTLDTTPPSFVGLPGADAGLRIDGGAATTRDAAGRVYLELRGADETSGIAGVVLSADETLDEAPLPFAPLIADFALDAPGQDGRKQIFAQLVDAAGHRSAPVSASILLDRAAPTVTGVRVAGGAATTRERVVSVDLSGVSDALSGVAGVALDFAAFDCAAASFRPTAELRSVTLPPGDGEKQLWVCAADGAGNVTAAAVAAEAPVVLDTTPPRLAQLVLGDGSGWTQQTQVALDASIEGGGAFTVELGGDLAASVVLSSENLPASVDLGPGEGRRSLSVRLVDAAGNGAVPTLHEIVVDTAAPVLLAPRVGDGRGFVTDPGGATRIFVSCSDAVAASAELTLAIEDDESTSLYEGANQASVPVTLGAEEGPRSLIVTCRDAAGHEAVAAPVNVTVDHTPPAVASFTLNGGGEAEATREAAAVVHLLDLSDAVSPVAGTAVRESAFDCAAARYDRPGQGSFAVTLSPGDGIKTLFLCAIDAAGNTTSAAVAADNTLRLDSTAPRLLGLTLGDGSGWSDSAEVAIDAQAGGPAEAFTLELDGDLPQPLAIASTELPATITLAGGDGRHTLSARLVDAAGNASTTLLRSIGVDSGAPVIAGVQIGHGGFVTDAGGSANISVSCTDAVAAAAELHLEITEGELVRYDGVNRGLVAIALGTDEGARSLSVTCRDPAGNVASASDLRAVVDHTPPVIASVAIGSGEVGAATRTRTVAVRLLDVSDATSEVAATAVGESSFDCAAANYDRPGSGSFEVTLSPGQGLKRLWLCAVDAAGNRTPSAVEAGNTVLLDTEAPVVARASLGDGTGWSRTATVAVDAAAQDDEPFTLELAGDVVGPRELASEALPATVELSAGEGPRSVSMRLIDAAGNASAPVVRTVVLDAVAPTIAAPRVGDGRGFVTDAGGATRVVVGCADARAAAGELRVEIEDEADGAILYDGPNTGALPVVLGAAEGARSLVARCHDPAGNIASAAPVTVTVDHTAPVVTAFSVNGGQAAEATRERAAVVHLDDLSDAVSGVAGTALRELAFDCASARYDRPGSGSLDVVLSAGDGVKTLWLCAIDAAGNTTAAAVQAGNTVVLDTTASTLTRFALGDGSGWSRVETVAVDAEVAGGGAFTLELTGDVTDPLALGSADLPGVAALRPGQGRRTISARAVDAAGNASAPLVGTVTVDTGAPVLEQPRVGDGSGFVTHPEGVTTVSAPCTDALAAPGELRLQVQDVDADATIFDGPNLGPVPVTLGAGEGQRTLSVTCLDPAGNASDPQVVRVTVDHTPPVIAAFSAGTGGASFVTRERGVVVHLDDVSDAVSGVAATTLRESAFDCSVARYDGPASGDFVHTLSAGDGEKTLWLCAIDAAGNATAAAIQGGTLVTLDTAAPVATGLILGDGSGWSATSSVAVDATAGAGSGAFTLELTGDVAAPTEIASGDLPGLVALRAGAGRRTVSARLVDAAGNASAPLVQSLVVDADAPTVLSVEVGDGGGFVRDPAGTTTVLVLCTDSLAAPGELTLRLVDDGDVELYAGPYLERRAVSLPAGQGDREITATCTDPAGHAASGSSAFVYDNVPPAISRFEVNGGTAAEPTNDRALTLTYEVGDAGTVAVAFTERNSCAGVDFVHDAAGTATLVLTGAEGEHTIYLCARDAAGNLTGPSAASNTVVLDTTGPGIPELVRTDISDTQIDLSWTSPAGTASYELQRRLEGEGAFTAIATPLVGTTTLSDPVPAEALGRRRFYRIEAFDALGNGSGPSIEVDAGTPIEAASVVYVASRSERSLRIERPVGTAQSAASYRYEDAFGAVTTQPLALNATSFTLPPGSDRFNERLVLQNSNADSSLSWESEFAFGSSISVVDDAGRVGAHVRVDMDALGVMHAVYADSTNGTLKYLRLDGASEPIVVDPAHASQGGMGVELDAEGDLHVCYYDFGPDELRYVEIDQACRDNPANCNPIVVEGDGDPIGNDCDIAIDPSGVPHIIQYENFNAFPARLEYVQVTEACRNNAPASCAMRVIHEVAGRHIGRSPAAAFSADGSLHIAYYEITSSSIVRDRLFYMQVDGFCRLGVACNPIEMEDGRDISEVEMATDDDGDAHIVWTSGGLRYVEARASCLPGSCTARELTPDADNTAPHIVIDGEGTPQVAYEFEDDLWLTTATGNCPAAPDTCDRRRIGPAGTQFRIDGAGAYAMAFHDSSQGVLRQMRLDITRPRRLAIGSAGDLDLALTNGSAPRVLYSHTLDNTLQLLPIEGGGAQEEVATSVDQFINEEIAMAVDSAGDVHALWYDFFTPVTLRYRKHPAGPTISVDTGVGTEADLAIDPLGFAHVVYEKSGALHYRRLDAGGATVVTLSPLDGSANVGRHCEIAVGTAGDAHIVYYDGNNTALKYVTVSAAGAPGVPVTLDDDGAVGTFATLALDGDEVPHIAYFDASLVALRYLRHDGASEPLVLDRASVGEYPGIDIDADGVPHICYSQGTSGLRYIRLDQLSAPQALDDGNANECRIAVDDAGAAHVVYRSGGTGSGLKYVRASVFRRLAALRVTKR